MTENPTQYYDQAPEAGRPWLREFWNHVEKQCPDLPLTMFRSTPMYKFADSYLKGYVMFTTAKTHFSGYS